MSEKTSTKEPIEEPMAFSTQALQHNNGILEFCRTAVFLGGGCTAGVLGMTGLLGFFFFAFLYVFFFVLMLWKTGNQLSSYFAQWSFVVTGSFSNNLLTYILFWTFFYGIVHVY